jgi:hypothetical protein
MQMQAKGFFGSLFDYSFSSYITPRIIKVLYILATVLVALWTVVFILLAFRASSTLGILVLLIGGPIYFVIMMIWTRVLLEFFSAFFRIHEDVRELNLRAGGAEVAPTAAPIEAAPVASSAAVEPAAAASLVARFCENCGTERTAGKRFCTGCGEALA